MIAIGRRKPDREAVAQARDAFLRDSGSLTAGESDYDRCLLHIVEQVQRDVSPSKVIAQACASFYPDELLAEIFRQYKLKSATRHFFFALLRGPAVWWGDCGFQPELLAKNLTYGDMNEIVGVCKKYKADLKATPLLRLTCWDIFWNCGIQDPLLRRRPDFLLAWEEIKKSRHGIKLGDESRACRMSIKGFRAEIDHLYDAMTEAGLVGKHSCLKEACGHPYGWDLLRELEGEAGRPFNLTRNRRKFLEIYFHFRRRMLSAKARRRALAEAAKPLPN